MNLLTANAICSTILHILDKADTELPFCIQSTDGEIFQNLLAMQNLCRVRFGKEKVPLEIVLVAYGPMGEGPHYFLWLEEGQEATIKPRADHVKHVPIKSLKIGSCF